MYGLELYAAPASEPVTTAELKAHLRLNTTDEDSLLSGFISAARQLWEGMTDRSCLTTTWKLHLDAFPAVIRLPRAPLQSVTSVKYYDQSDTQVTWDAANYSVDTKREPGRIVPKVWFPDWKVFPVYPPLSYRTSPKIEVLFVAGWTSDTLPALVKQAVLLLAAHYYQRRDAHIEGSLTEVPLGFAAIVNQFKTGWIGNMNPPMFNPHSYGYGVE